MSDKARTFGPAHLPDLLNDNKLMLAKITELDSIIDSLQRDLAERDATIAELRAELDKARTAMRVQAAAVKMLDAKVRVLAAHDRAAAERARPESRPEALESERAMSAKLTEELDALRSRAEAAETKLIESRRLAMTFKHERDDARNRTLCRQCGGNTTIVIPNGRG